MIILSFFHIVVFAFLAEYLRRNVFTFGKIFKQGKAPINLKEVETDSNKVEEEEIIIKSEKVKEVQ